VSIQYTTTKSPLVDEYITRNLKEFLTGTPRQGTHVSDLTRCITYTFWGKTTTLNASMEIRTMLYMISGMSLEDALTNSIGTKEDSLEKDGVIMSPDMVISMDDTLHVEIKTTRMYLAKDGRPKYGWSNEWLRRLLSYCYVAGVDTYALAVLFIIPAEMVNIELTFKQEDIDRFWQEFILPRKEALERAIEKNRPPQPYTYNEDWECERCSAQILCSTFSMQGSLVVDERTTHSDQKYLNRDDQEDVPFEELGI